MTPSASYLVCATSRSGSNLLCGLLKGTGVAGRPEAYFGEHEPCWARRWGASEPVEYVHGAIREGTGAGGVFGAKVLWLHLPGFLAKLEAVQGRWDLDERALLEGTFPGLRFVWIRREDVVAQAVSFAKAMQTDQWTALDPRRPDRVPRFDFAQIHRFVGEIEEQNAAWRRWFRANGITPHHVSYEDLVADMEAVTRRLLGSLDVAVPEDTAIAPQHERQADSVNAEWAVRYRQMVL